MMGDWVNNSELNPRLSTFFKEHFDGKSVKRRLLAYNKHVEGDKDRIRMHGQYYNNIYLGKRIFGPARKQIFTHTLVGGMERRFEIVDNQVNHIQFTHEVSDKFQEKCRNPRIKCRDDTRVILNYPEGEMDSFIHANYIKSSLLFNDFIVTQAPMENTIQDFWRMIWQEKAAYIFMLIDSTCLERCAPYWPIGDKKLKFCGLQIINNGIETPSRDPFFQITHILIMGPNGEQHRLEHWQADMNNSEDFNAPLRLLQLARSSSSLTVVHDHLGISRAACLVSIEICITQLVRGPTPKRLVQNAVHYLRSMRPFSIETPMQYIFIHRVVQHFIRPMVGLPKGFEQDYIRWLDERSQRLFVDDLNREVPAFRLLSPKVDPDLLPLVRHRERPESRREIHAHVGELPLPVERFVMPEIANNKKREKMDEGEKKKSLCKTQDPRENGLEKVNLPSRYPRGKRY